MVDQQYTNLFVRAAKAGKFDLVKEYLSEHPEVLNSKESGVSNINDNNGISLRNYRLVRQFNFCSHVFIE